MTHFKNNKKNNAAITVVTTLLTIMILLLSSIILQMPAQAILDGTSNTGRLAPVVVSGDNIYIAWWANTTTENGNEEVMFRASNDAGGTFSDKINLSNTTDADSWRVEVAAEGADVIVAWWETNQTSDTPVARISIDGGQTFGPMLMLAANGTLGSGEAEEIAVAGGEEG